MYLRLISIFIIIFTYSQSHADDNVADWLRRMGCEELLARHFENQLEQGDRKSKIQAAKQLANVYAVMLARSDQVEDRETLELAISLFDRIPEAGTTDLKLQLYRATYIAAEQILERYRLRISDIEEAAIATSHLKEVVNDLQQLRDSLLKTLRNSKTQNEKKQQQLGLVTSYLAWAHYYIAWYEDSAKDAKAAEALFVEILDGDSPHLQAVSLDLKSYETGARSILGIALCKSILNDPVGPDPWLEELESTETWSTVRSLVPLWRFLVRIDNRKWQEVLTDISSPTADSILMYRIAAVHALEDYANPIAKEVADKAITGLIDTSQLGILSDIITAYGSAAMEKDGFIASYIQGDIQYRNITKTYQNDEPPQDVATRQNFAEVADLFKKATKANDISEYPQLLDDCQFMLGLSYYYSSQFAEASLAFERAAEGNNKEQAIWMAIVSLDRLETLSEQQKRQKKELSSIYLVNWPNSEHASQLTIHQSSTAEASTQSIQELLAIPYSDPKYEDAQRQAARSLYTVWSTVSDDERQSIGNSYISVAMPLILSDSTKTDDPKAVELAVARSMRVLEVSLHPEISRLTAARNALETIHEIQKRNTFDMSAFQTEIRFRNILLLLNGQQYEDATTALLGMIQEYPENKWTTIASKSVWGLLQADSTISNDLLLTIGNQILQNLTDYQLADVEYLQITTRTATAAFQLFMASNDEEAGKEALRLSRILAAQKPGILQINQLSAQIEQAVGDTEQALTRWKSIASSSQKGALVWLEARYNIILILSEQFPIKALALLDQHQIIYPDYGAAPYGEQLQNLHSQLREDENDN